MEKQEFAGNSLSIGWQILVGFFLLMLFLIVLALIDINKDVGQNKRGRVKVKAIQEELVAMEKKIEKLKTKHASSNVYFLEQRLTNLQKELKDLRKEIIYNRNFLLKQKNLQKISPLENHTKEPPKDLPRIWLKRGEPYSLQEDPYFENLPRGTLDDQSIVIRIGADEKGFNPILENTAEVSAWQTYYVNDTLAQQHWKDPSKWAPHLAIRIEVSEDNREFTIYLRKGVYWHSPPEKLNTPRYDWLKKQHEITSHDFFFTYTTIINREVLSYRRSVYKDIESFQVIDKYTFSIRWKSSLYTNLAYTFKLFPLPEFIYSYDRNGDKIPASRFAKKFRKHWYNRKMMGCGPYKFSEYVPNQHLKLERNEDYYGYKPAIKHVKFVIIQDEDLAYQKLKSKEVDLIPRLSAKIYRNDIYSLNSQSPFYQNKLDYQLYLVMAHYDVKWNNRHPIFRDKMVRRAMSYALNRKQILKKMFMGLGVITIGAIPPSSIYYNHNIKPYDFNLKLAHKILIERGWRDEDGDGILEKVIDGERRDFEFFLDHSKKKKYSDMYNLYSQDLRKIGVKLKVRSLNWPSLVKKLEDKNFDAIHVGWLEEMPLDFYPVWHSSNAEISKSSNHIQFRNVEVDSICQKMRESMEFEERKKLATRIQEIWHDEQPYTFLFFIKDVAAYNSRLKNCFIRKYPPHILIHPYYVK